MSYTATRTSSRPLSRQPRSTAGPTGWSGSAGPPGPVLELVQAECDRANLLAVLRDPALEMPRLLPPGWCPNRRCWLPGEATRSPLLAARPGWRQPLNGTSATLTSPRSNGTWRRRVAPGRAWAATR